MEAFFTPILPSYTTRMISKLLIITTGGTIDKIYFDALSQFEVGESRTESLVKLYNAIYSNQDWRPANLGIGPPLEVVGGRPGPGGQGVGGGTSTAVGVRNEISVSISTRRASASRRSRRAPSGPFRASCCSG